MLKLDLRAEEEILSDWGRDFRCPLVSVCCPAYQHEKFLEDSIRGFLIQVTRFPFEIIIHDDASSDATLKIAQRYQEIYPKIIRVLSQKENQRSKGRRILPEFLFPNARGKYIAVCEGDDYWVDERKLQIQIDFLEMNPDYVICYSDAIGLDQATGNTVKVSGTRRDLSSSQLQATASLFTLTTCFRNVLTCWPQELSRGPYGDLMVWSLLGDYGKGKYVSQISPSVYRKHGGGLHSMQSREKQISMSIETLMTLFLYRWKCGNARVAYMHLENILVLIVKLRGVSLVPTIVRRWLCRRI